MILDREDIPGRRNCTPRASGGDPFLLTLFYLHQSVLPAQAGVIPYPMQMNVMEDSTPRASGGDPDSTQTGADEGEYSPRKRG